MKTFNKIIQKPEMIRNMGLFFMLALLANILLPDLVMAAEDIGQMAERLKDTITPMQELMKTGFKFIGLCLVGGAIAVFATIKKSMTPVAVPLGMLMAGILLWGISGFLEVGTATFLPGSGD
ncbi:MAG: hypothetical protein GY729_19895 [Desulfobacteraceae bacterium]|nr:hypothetical protein [Desulfobacteraceae bacterium]